MGTTPLHALPYPELDNVDDVPADLKKLADAIDPIVLPTTVVAAAATRVVASLLAAGHAQPAFRFLGDGKHEWGAGGSAAPDTNLYRTGAGVLKTDGIFSAASSIYSSVGAATQLQMASDGRLYFGNANDTQLYRFGASALATDSRLFLRGAVCVLKVGPNDAGTFGNTNGDRGLYLGNTSQFPGTPSDGGYLYAASGVLHWRGASGTDTVLAPA